MRADQTIACDVLVVGAGLAGLRAAYDAARAGCKVLIAAKAKLCSGASFYPLTAGLGSQLPKDQADVSLFMEELLDSGAGIADENLCRIMVEEIEGEIKRLPDIGITPEEFGGRVACFAKRERKLVRWSDWNKIRNNVRNNFSEIPNIKVMEFCDLLKLTVRDNAVCGAVLCDNTENIVYVNTPAVILATGGYCGLYKHSLNTDDVCGIGHSVALEAGAKLINLEFMQFIPGLMSPIYKLLFGEMSLQYCVEVTDENGNPALRNYLPKNVSFEDCLNDRSMHGPFTCADKSMYFDLSMMDYAIKQKSEKGFTLRFSPEIAKKDNEFLRKTLDFYLKNGIDLSKQGISVAPFAHCANGGIWINEHGETGVEGLFAAGETAGGIHGADRHGGAATSVCLVFGRRAADRAVKYIKTHKPADIPSERAVKEIYEWIDNGATSGISPQEILYNLKERLWFYANVIRNENNLTETLSWVKEMQKHYNAAKAIRSGYDIKLSMKAFHALRTSQAVLSAMLFRKESRGSHYREDYPESDDSLYGKRIIAEEKNDILVCYT
ncbi:MAG TPA: FAD-binding protein [Clostridiaceae bacterium]|nr:FAD-binding protein [Clostridiaceae bacterium]